MGMVNIWFWWSPEKHNIYLLRFTFDSKIKRTETYTFLPDFSCVLLFLCFFCSAISSFPSVRGFCKAKQRNLTLKEPGYFDPSHSRRGGQILPPLKISETDRWNIKCVVLVDSYDPPESIGTKKIQNIPCMTSQWRHKWRTCQKHKNHQKSPKSWFFAIFSSKSCMF